MPLGFGYFDPMYLLFLAPALLLAMLAQFWMRSAYAAAEQQPASMSGARAARAILDGAGLHHVGVEQVGGVLSDHYDPRDKILRLSTDVFHGRSLAAVGIAAHEAGHAIQDGVRYAPLVLRNLAVPLAGFGSQVGLIMLFIGWAVSNYLAWAGLGLFSLVVIFQLINLPVEFDASARAKRLLVSMGFVEREDMRYVNSVLNAAALTYVAGTLQAILQVLYYALLLMNRGRDDRKRW